MAYYTQKEFENDMFFDNPKIKGKDLLGKRADEHLSEIRTFLSNAEKSISNKKEQDFVSERKAYLWHYCRVFYTTRPKNMDYVTDRLITLIKDANDPEMAGFLAAVLRACLKRTIKERSKEECKTGFFFLAKTVQDMFFSDVRQERKKAAYIGRYVNLCAENHNLSDTPREISPCRAYTLNEHLHIYKEFTNGRSIKRYKAYDLERKPSTDRSDYIVLMNAATYAKELIAANIYDDNMGQFLKKYVSLFKRFEKPLPYKIEGSSYYKEKIRTYRLLKDICTLMDTEDNEYLISKTLPYYTGCELDNERIKALSLRLITEADKEVLKRLDHLCDKEIIKLNIWNKIRYPLKMVFIIWLTISIPSLLDIDIIRFLFGLYSFAFSIPLIGIPFIIIPSLVTLLTAYESLSHKNPKQGYYMAGASSTYSHGTNKHSYSDRQNVTSQDSFDKWYYAQIPKCSDINFDIDGYVQNKWISERFDDM